MPRSRYTDWDDEIVYSYEVLQQSLQTIGDRIHWSANFVRNRLIANGIELRGKGAAGGGGPRIDQRKIDLAVKLRIDKGMTVGEIGHIMGASDHAVVNWLQKAGVYRPMNRHRDYCVNGHKMTPSNTYVWNSHRRCKKCKNIQNRKYMKKIREEKNERIAA